MSYKNLFRFTLTLLFCLVLLIAGVIYTVPEKVFSEDSQLSRNYFLAKTLLSPDLMTSVDTNGEKLVALTFDDGPDPIYTAQVLDILKENAVPATFFVVGQHAVLRPDLVQRAVREGHEIENHTYTHPHLDTQPAMRVEEEISNTEAVITTLSNYRPVYFRPPRRMYNQQIIDTSKARGYRLVLWTIGLEHHASQTPEEMAQRVIDKASPGMIILAHDGILDRSRTVAALPMVIKGYRGLGYRFVTLQELVEKGDSVAREKAIQAQHKQ